MIFLKDNVQAVKETQMPECGLHFGVCILFVPGRRGQEAKGFIKFSCLDESKKWCTYANLCVIIWILPVAF